MLMAMVWCVLLSIFPHHHHVGGGFCMTVQVCLQDGHINDQHTRTCHDAHVDRHQLYLLTAQRNRLQPLAHQWQPYTGPYVLPLSVASLLPAPTFIFLHAPRLPRDTFHAPACHHGRLCKRRGPPSIG